MVIIVNTRKIDFQNLHSQFDCFRLVIRRQYFYHADTVQGLRSCSQSLFCFLTAIYLTFMFVYVV